MRFYINGHQIDLYEKERISYSKQVNHLKDLASRQTNFTHTFKAPATAKNIALFEGLGITGSNSPLPYKKNPARLFLGNICIIFSGWAIFKSAGKDFSIHTYDGNIDFFKRLDNVKFGDINLSELSHTKDVAEIKDNWENGNPFYKYLLADYNGETHFKEGTTTYINADYLIPSVPIKYLWERIFQTFGFTFSGTVFQEEEFLNLFLTYPKGVISGSVANLAFQLNFEDVIPRYKLFTILPLYIPVLFNSLYFEGLGYILNDGSIVSNTTDADIKSWMAAETGYYNLKISGSITGGVMGGRSQLYYGKNLHNANPDNLEPTNGNLDFVAEAEFKDNITIDFEKNIFLYAGETLAPFYDRAWDDYTWNNAAWGDTTDMQFEFQVFKIEQTAIDQSGFFKGLTPKDFYKEVMWRFGLTPFPVKDQDHIEFLTYQERVNGETLDWSDKFIRKDSEKYIYNGYAKNNYFRFKYNGEEDDYNDGVIKIDNENLEEKTDVIKSKTYSVEKLPVDFAIGPQTYPVPKFQLWKKEVVEEAGATKLEYSPRDSRFSFVRELEIMQSVDLGSKQLGQYAAASKVRSAENYNYSFQQVIENRYQAIKSLFKNTLIVKADFFLSEAEFDGFDLKKNIYVKQLGGKFLVDKITKRDLTKKETQLELIKINR